MDAKIQQLSHVVSLLFINNSLTNGLSIVGISQGFQFWRIVAALIFHFRRQKQYVVLYHNRTTP